MSDWTHKLCEDCWKARNPGRRAIRLTIDKPEPCCGCGEPTDSGIYIRAPKAEMLHCPGHTERR